MKILIADADDGVRSELEATLRPREYETAVATDGRETLAALEAEGAPDLAIVECSLPEVDGLEVCRRVRRNMGSRPVYIILSGAKSGEEDDIAAALDAGADDFVAKPFDTAELCARIKVGERTVNLQKDLAGSVAELRRKVAELERAGREIRDLAMRDELTGLYNRRGFLHFAEQHRKWARREARALRLIYVDVDGLKGINDSHGHLVGSGAIREAGGILARTFRESDLIARIGGDEFTALIPEDATGNIRAPIRRLTENLRDHNAQSGLPYRLSLSAGAVRIGPRDDSPLEGFLAEADEAMYDDKKRKPAGARYAQAYRPDEHAYDGG